MRFDVVKLTVPTLLMPHVKKWLAMAAHLASIGHIGSESAPTVADGLKTISAPFKPYIILKEQ